MNRTAKLIATAATGLFLLASGPRAFSQSKMAPEPIKKVSASSKKSNGTRTLCVGDTLFLKGLAPAGSKPKLRAFASKNAAATKDWVASNGKPGHFSGQLIYKSGNVEKVIPVSVRFKDSKADYAYLQPDGPLPERALQGIPKRPLQKPGMRDFFRMSPLEDTRAYGGAVIFIDSYGVPNIGVNLDSRVKRLGDNWAIRSSITIAVGAKKFRISGFGEGTRGDSVFREANARNIETYASLGLEFGTGNLSVVASPFIGVVLAAGKCSETSFFSSSSGGTTSYTSIFSYNRWKSFTGLTCSFSANFDVVKVAVFADVKWAIAVDGFPVPDSHAKSILNYGVSIKFPLRSFGASRSGGHYLPSR